MYTKKVKLINHVCLLILMLLYIMLYIVLAIYLIKLYLMLFVCIMLFFFFANAFCFHALSWFIDTVSLCHVLFCIMHSAFSLLVFLISMFTAF